MFMHLCVYVCVLCFIFRRKEHPNSITEIQRVRRFNLLAIAGFRAQTVTQNRHLYCNCGKIVVEVRVDENPRSVCKNGFDWYIHHLLNILPWRSISVYSFLSAPISCVILLWCKMAVGARQGSGCGLPSPRRSGSKQVNQVQLHKHTLSKRKFPVQSASFHFTVSVHLPDHLRQRVWGTAKECHCGQLHDYRTKSYILIYCSLWTAA